MQSPLDRCLNALYTSHTLSLRSQNKTKLNRNLIRGKPTIVNTTGVRCAGVEPNDAERHSLQESDAEISQLESEILALKVEGKKLLNIE